MATFARYAPSPVRPPSAPWLPPSPTPPLGKLSVEGTPPSPSSLPRLHPQPLPSSSHEASCPRRGFSSTCRRGAESCWDPTPGFTSHCVLGLSKHALHQAGTSSLLESGGVKCRFVKSPSRDPLSVRAYAAVAVTERQSALIPAVAWVWRAAGNWRILRV